MSLASQENWIHRCAILNFSSIILVLANKIYSLLFKIFNQAFSISTKDLHRLATVSVRNPQHYSPGPIVRRRTFPDIFQEYNIDEFITSCNVISFHTRIVWFQPILKQKLSLAIGCKQPTRLNGLINQAIYLYLYFFSGDRL